MAIISGIKIFGSGSKPPVLEELQITENGTYTPSDGVDGFNPVNVDVQPPLQSKSVEITANGQSTIEPDSEYYGLESVGLNVNVQPNLQTKSTSTTITENGMTVSKDDTDLLTANDKGVMAKDLNASTYLIIGGRSRFENYKTDRTGCFWIGG